ncbi:hypothetical protein [Halogeometricum borinquense]|uniref:hypothetical protein n=1 Tax=Halogeometricum borinquense TaxID=60847 RepID=UPI0034268B04
MRGDWSRRRYLGALAGVTGTFAASAAGAQTDDPADNRSEDDLPATLTLRIPADVAGELDLEEGDSVLYQGGGD